MPGPGSPIVGGKPEGRREKGKGQDIRCGENRKSCGCASSDMKKEEKEESVSMGVWWWRRRGKCW